MLVRALYFAQIRQALGQTDEAVTLPEGSTCGDLLDHLATLHQAVARLRPVLRLAVNERFVQLSHRLAEGDEVALIQPVAGGGPYCRVSAEPLVLQEVIDAVSHQDQGGIATFTGVVRRHNQGKEVLRLEYEAYTPMVLRTLGDIIQRIEAAWPGTLVAIVHRTGVLQIGEAAVVIAASAPHRAESFAACQRAIDLLKQEVPIWKKEVSPQGEEWLGERP